ncbi:membrane protein [Streptomyces phage RedBear]|nr:membrane protein [Streptomyces phage RedBear]QZE10764.1 membrane protein [Streptomyces phage Katalie]QZE11058.1 membrane protein [Streptomyces phage South40]
MSEVTADQRKRNLAQAVQREVVSGFRVESQTDETAILAKGKPTNHVLHLLLTLVTLGLWVFVWIIVALSNKETRLILSVDEYGNVLRQTA